MCCECAMHSALAPAECVCLCVFYMQLNAALANKIFATISSVVVNIYCVFHNWLDHLVSAKDQDFVSVVVVFQLTYAVVQVGNYTPPLNVIIFFFFFLLFPYTLLLSTWYANRRNPSTIHNFTKYYYSHILLLLLFRRLWWLLRMCELLPYQRSMLQVWNVRRMGACAGRTNCRLRIAYNLLH